MPSTTTLNETQRSPIDGTEWVRLATGGANWKAQLGTQNWVFQGIFGGNGASSTLTLGSTTGAGTSDAIIFQTGSQVQAGSFDTSQRLIIGSVANQLGRAIELHRSNAQPFQANVAWANDNSNVGSFFGYKSKSATIGTQAAVAAGDLLMLMGGYGSDGTNFQQAARIDFVCDATPSSGIVPGRIVFNTQNASGALTQGGLVDDGQNFVWGTAALATNATHGFLYLPTCAGTPTGSPTSYTGRDPLVYDTTDHELFVFDTNSSAWLPVLFGPVWTQTNPTATPGSGSFTTTTSVLNSIKVGHVFFFNYELTVTTLGTASGNISVTMPFSASNDTACPFVDITQGSATGVVQWLAGSTLTIIPQSPALSAHRYATSGVVHVS